MLSLHICRGREVFVFIIVYLLFLSGCATPSSPYRAFPDPIQKTKPVRTIELLPPQVGLYEFGIGGSTEKLDDRLSSTAKENVARAVLKRLDRTRVPAIKIFPEDKMSQQTASVLNKASRSDRLSVAELRDLNTENADALLIVSGVGYVLSENNKRLLGFPWPGLLFDFALNIGLTAATGGQVYIPPIMIGSTTKVPVQENYSYIRLTLIDPDTGDVLWRQLLSGPHSLLDDRQAYAMVEQLLGELPAGPAEGN